MLVNDVRQGENVLIPVVPVTDKRQRMTDIAKHVSHIKLNGKSIRTSQVAKTGKGRKQGKEKRKRSFFVLIRLGCDRLRVAER